MTSLRSATLALVCSVATLVAPSTSHACIFPCLFGGGGYGGGYGHGSYYPGWGSYGYSGYSSYGMGGSYAPSSGGCSSCQSSYYAPIAANDCGCYPALACNSCNPCASNACGGNCGFNCAGGNCASGNCPMTAPNSYEPLPDSGVPDTTITPRTPSGKRPPSTFTPTERDGGGVPPLRDRTNEPDADGFAPPRTRPGTGASDGLDPAAGDDFGAPPERPRGGSRTNIPAENDTLDDPLNPPGGAKPKPKPFAPNDTRGSGTSLETQKPDLGIDKDSVIQQRKPAASTPIEDKVGPELEPTTLKLDHRRTAQPVLERTRLSIRGDFSAPRMVRTQRPSIRESATPILTDIVRY